jgi:lipopolysaccharide transport system ATP-binding protein
LNPILEIKGISKKFQISHEREPYLSIRDSISGLFSKSGRATKENFWALKDISFEVHQGDSIGIIGKNGAGKSTLLKILSKITPPTSGRIVSRGRIASLLEVGTGFHPELTGKENIFLNGSILGMRRREIISKFDELVDFSGVERFLDTPLKHYSSGMQLRLAFAVAAYLEPEILVIDEVLAVGDSVFQQKCIAKMNEVSRSGRTILFVSHNMAFVSALCNRGVFLLDGRVNFIGDVNEIISAYSSTSMQAETEYNLSDKVRTVGAGQLIFDRLRFEKNPIQFGEKIKIYIRFKSHTVAFHKNLDIGININNNYNECLIHCCNRFVHTFVDHVNDSIEYCFEIENVLKPGNYILNLFVRANDVIQDYLTNAVGLEILDGNPYNFYETAQIQGQIFPPFTFSHS